MSPMRIIRRVQLSITCLALVCFFCAGCRTDQERISIDRPWKAFKAEDGSLMLGYYVQPELQRGWAGWHWLVVEPELAEKAFEPVGPGMVDTPESVVMLEYEGWFKDAEMIPELNDRGFTDPTPPKWNGELTPLEYIWDAERGQFSLIDPNEALLPWVEVSPGFAVLKTREVGSTFMLSVLQIAAVAGLVTGVVLLDGTVMFSTYGGYTYFGY